jgi:TRAP-type C4-dicarboxylate transport system permease large subunit
MVVLGLLLLLASAGLTLGVVLSNTDPVTASAFGVSLSDVSVGGLFLAGVIAGAVAMLGLGILLMGAARKRSRRVESNHRVQRVRSEKAQLAEENAALRAQIAEPYPATGEPAPVETA